MDLSARSDKGFTLLEVLVALTLFSIVLLGLLGAFLKAFEYSLRNELRNEAIKIVQEELEKYRNINFGAIVPVSVDCSSSTEKIKRQVKSTYVEYTIAKVISNEVPGSVKKIQITACWEYKGKNYTYTAQTLITPY